MLRRRLVLAAVAIVLGVSICLANAKGPVGNQMPMILGTGAAVVMSGSMSPTLEVGDLVVVQEKDDYEVGDVVVYQSGSKLIVHRIIARAGDQVVTQGQANNVADPPIDSSAIKGKVVAHVPGLGLAVNALKTPVGILLVLIAAFALTEFSFRREKDRSDKELEAIQEEIRRLKSEQDEES